MAACEICWSAAYMVSRLNGTHQADEYRVLLAENDQEHEHTAASSVDGGQP